jgi:predicted house-cleaning noncanonical NTP pyrophosphatase (MazG superfamily)
MRDVAATIHEDADLAPDLKAKLGEFAGEFLVDDAINRYAAA